MTESKKKAMVLDSDSDDDDYYSNMVQGFDFGESDSDTNEKSSSSSKKTTIKKSKDPLVFLDNDDDDLDLEKSYNFEKDIREQALRADMERKRKYERELEEIEKAARIKAADVGDKPRNIYVVNAYEEGMTGICEIKEMVNDVVNKRLASKGCTVIQDSSDDEMEPRNASSMAKILVKHNFTGELKTKTVYWAMDKRFEELFEDIAEETETSVDAVSMIFKRDTISSRDTPSEVGMIAGKEHVVDIISVGTNTKLNPTITFQQDGKPPIHLSVHRDTTFSDIRQMLRDRGVVFKKMRFDDDYVKDQETPHSIGLTHEDCLDLF